MAIMHEAVVIIKNLPLQSIIKTKCNFKYTQVLYSYPLAIPLIGTGSLF